MGETGELPHVDQVHIERPKKEVLNGKNEYRKTLAACFDKDGNFDKAYVPAGKYLIREIWDGEHVAADLLHEPEAAEFQAVFLGIRPMFFYDTNSLPSEHSPDEWQRFFNEKGINLGVYSHKIAKRASHASAAIYRTDSVRKVLEENKDVFDDYESGEPIDSYLKRGLRWDGLEDLSRQNPLEAFRLASLYEPEGEINDDVRSDNSFNLPLSNLLYGGAVKWDRAWAPDIAKKQALRIGLLLGFPKEVLEKEADEKIKLMEIRDKLVVQHNALMGSSAEYEQLLAERVRDGVQAGVLEMVKRRRDFFPDITDDDMSLLKRQDRYFMYRQNQPSVTTAIEEINDRIKSTVQQSGIKDVQEEFVQKYRTLKMKGLTGALRRLLKVKTRADNPQ